MAGETTISSAVGSKAYIGGSAAAGTLAALQADATYLQIKSLRDLGEWGIEAAELDATDLSSGWARRRKGRMDGNTLDLICMRDALDPGQNALKAALKADGALEFSFKVELADKPTATGKPSTIFAKIVVLSARNSFGDGGEITGTTFKIGFSGEVFEVPASLT